MKKIIVLFVTIVTDSFFLRNFVGCMEKIRFNVVGLYHWDVRDRWKEYAEGAVGKQLTMQPQPENVKDPYAVRVREGRWHIGYVAVPDLDVVYQALKGCNKERLRGVVVASNPEPPVLTVECEVEKVDWNYDPFDDSVYQGWHYDGLPLMPRKLEQLGDLTADLIDELEKYSQGEQEVISMVESLLAEHLYDMSREMTRARYRIERLLAQSGDDELQGLARQLQQQKGMLMTHDHRDEVARYLFLELPQQLQEKGLEASHYTYDNRLDELESQLRAFPFQLYDKFLSDPVDFLREVYYKHVPRKYLFQLLSGIVLMILKGRVKIQRWGREGDTEPIGQIRIISRKSNSMGIDPVLSSERAIVFWDKLEEKGFVDEHYCLMPSTTRQQAMYIADKFSSYLRMKAKWKPFEQLWGIKNIAQEKYTWLESGKSPSRADEIDEVFRS